MTLHVAYAINEDYVGYCLTSAISLLENNKDARFRFHILTDSLSERAKKRFRETLPQGQASVAFYEIPDEKVETLALNGWGKYAWYRLFLPELLDSRIDRVLYLDTDTIVMGSLADLFATDLEGCSLAGCMDYMGFYNGIYGRLGYPRKYGYICSGVILFNLDYFRCHNQTSAILEFAAAYPERIHFPDQDAINGVCHKTMKLLPLKFDMLAPFFADNEFVRSHKDGVAEMLRDPRIAHYAGCNPWKKECPKHYFYNVFWKYASMVGGIELKRTITGIDLLKHRVKMLLGILGIPAFLKFRPKPKPDFAEVCRLASGPYNR